MTAEISIMNRLGVALAADSAVSIGTNADKVWTSAEKLFQLSEVDPIGVMVYGDAEFVGLPWETIIKSYRSQYGRIKHATVEEHARTLISYLESNGSLFPQSVEDGHVLALTAAVLYHVRSVINQELDNKAKENNGLEEDEIAPILDATVKERLDFFAGRDQIEGLPPDWSSQLKKKYEENFRGQIQVVFGNLPLSLKTRRNLISICVQMLGRKVFGPRKAGLVVAGFGSEQFLPALEAYEVEGLVLGKVRLNLEEREIIGTDSDAVIIPFAQKEMVHTFMDGIDPALRHFMTKSMRRVLSGVGDLVTNALALGSAEQRKLIKEGIETLSSDLEKEWAQERKKYWSPIVTNIATLPKDELAAMAEAFISLTKFKRRVSSDRETVGGPIDVAVITRGDGFIWVNRKHYFDPEKNPRFITKLGR